MNLLKNPFYIINASLRDSKENIIKLAENTSLLNDSLDVDSCLTILTTPRKRIAAEISWLPGLTISKVKYIIESVKIGEPPEINFEINPIIWNNIFATLLNTSNNINENHLLDLVIIFAENSEEIDFEYFMKIINEERTAAGFSNINDVKILEQEWTNHKNYYLDVIFNYISNKTDKVKFITLLIEKTTYNGKKQAPLLIEKIVEKYHLENKFILDKHETEIKNEMALIHEYFKGNQVNEEKTKIILRTFEDKLIEWDKIAQPIQVMQLSRGLKDQDSSTLAFELRDFLVNLANTYGVHDKNIFLTLNKIFAEIPDFIELNTKDIVQITKIIDDKQKNIKEVELAKKDYENKINLSLTWGLIFKDRFGINIDGINYNSYNLPLHDIKSYSFTYTQHSINGIPSGKTCNIYINGHIQKIEITPPVSYFDTIMEKLWYAVGYRIFEEILNEIITYQKFIFHQITIFKNGILLPKTKYLFFSDEPYLASWKDLNIYSYQGSVVITSYSCTNAQCQFEYKVPNAFIIEKLIKFLLSDKNYVKLLNGDIK